MPAMIQPSNKAKKIADKILGRSKEKTSRSSKEDSKEPQTTGQQANEQIDAMWRK